MSLFNQIKPKCKFSDLVLPEEVMNSMKELLEDLEFGDALTSNGLPVRRRVIIYGPSGCGKTSIAHALADELGIKLVSISLAQTLGSLQGESEKGIEKIFEFAAQNRVVVLLDEFDSFGSERRSTSSNGNSENRIVNTMLTEMEGRAPLGLIVACTNFIQRIDAAVLRRFDLQVELPPVSQEGLVEIAKLTLKERFGISVTEVLKQASTPSAVVKRAQDLLRRKVIEIEKARRAETLPLFDPANPAKSILQHIESGTPKRAAEVSL